MITPNSDHLRRRHQGRVAWSILACATLASSALAQTAPTPSPTEPADPARKTPPPPVESAESEETFITLNPFVINASQDAGYQASSSLAGIGLNTKLTDIGSSVSVITSKFLEDTGSNSLRELLIYQTGMETSGFGGNTSGTVDEGGGARGEPSLTNGNPGTRVRGLAPADNARDYFRSIVPVDSYIIDRVEINRGANALLFGTGSPSGIINTSTLGASLGKNSGRVELSGGSYGSWRASATYNVVPIPGQVGIRVASLVDRQDFQQKFTFSDSDRQYAALVVEPKFLRNRGILSSTTFRASFENGQIESNRPRSLPPSDGYSTWFPDTLSPDLVARGAIPKVSYDPTGLNAWSTNATTGVRTLNTSTFSYNSLAIGNRLATLQVVDNVNRAPIYFFQDVYSNIPADNIQVNPYSAVQNQGRIFGRPGVLDNFVFPAETRTVFNGTGNVVVNLPVRTNIAVMTSSAPDSRARNNYAVPDASFLTGRGMNDPSVFDFFNSTLVGPNSEGITDFQAFNTSLQQLMFEQKLGFEVSYSYQTFEESLQSLMPSGTPRIAIDTNTRMWTGEVNPNYGRPFVSTPGDNNWVDREIQTTRAKAYYEFDAEDRFRNRAGWILGKHVISALVQREEYDEETRSGAVFYTPDFWAPGNGQARKSNTGKRVATWTYLGDRSNPAHFNGGQWFSAPSVTSLSGAGLMGLQANMFDLPNIVNGNGVLFSRLRAATAAEATGANAAQYAPFVTPVLLLRDDRKASNTSNTARLVETTLKSEAISLQSNWLGDHIVTTVGWRDEESVARAGTFTDFTLAGEAIDFRNPGYNINSPRVRTQIEEDRLFAWSAVAKLPKKYVEKIPKVSALNAYYGSSENFTVPIDRRINAFGENIEKEGGVTKDMGIYVEVLDGMISARFNYFETEQSNVSLPAGKSIPDFVIDAARRAFGSTSNGVVPRGSNVVPTETVDRNGVTLMANPYDPYFYPAGFVAPPSILNSTYDVRVERRASATAPGGFTYTFLSTDNGVTDTNDVTTEGLELEVQVKPTRGLTLTFNVAKVEAIRNNSVPAAARLLFSTPTASGAPLATEWIKPWANLVPMADGSAANANPNNPDRNPNDTFLMDNYFKVNSLNRYYSVGLADGQPTPELRKWRVNIVANYSFQHPWLRGVSVGGAARWQDRPVIGYPLITYDTSVDPTSGVVTLQPSDGVNEPTDLRGQDVSSPYFGPEELYFDGWIGYKRKILRDRVNFSVQLNVRNIGVGNKLIPIARNPALFDSAGNLVVPSENVSWRIAERQRYTLSTKFNF